MVLTDNERAERPLTVKDAAEYLQVTERTILSLLAKGALPAAKIGRQWRISRKGLDEYISGKTKKEWFE